MSGNSIPPDDFAVSEHTFIWTVAHRRAAGQLESAVNSPANVSLMLGKPGVGKSRLVEEVVEVVMLDQAVAIFTNPRRLDEDVVGAVNQAVMGLAESYSQNPTPVFIVDDAHRLHRDTLAKLLRMSHPPDGGDVVFKLVLVAQPGFGDNIKSFAPGNIGPAFELLPLDERDADAFVDEWLKLRALSGIFDDERQRKQMLTQAAGVPGALVGALERQLRNSQAAAPAPKTDTGLSKEPASTAGASAKVEAAAKADAVPTVAITANEKTAPESDLTELKVETAPIVEAAAKADTAPELKTKKTKAARMARSKPNAEPASTAEDAARPTIASKPDDNTDASSEFLAGVEPPGRFRLEVAVRQQQEFKKELRELEEGEKVAWPEIDNRDPSAGPMVTAPVSEEGPAAPTAAARQMPMSSHRVMRGVSIAVLGASIVAGALLAPQFSGSTLPPLLSAPADVVEAVDYAPVMQAIADLPPDASGALRSAILMGRTDAGAAAAAYAAAAARGEARAAYYLGQVYESGEGVAQSPSMAFLSYKAASAEIAASGERAEALRTDLAMADGPAEVTVLHALKSASGEGLFLWNAENIGPTVAFSLDFADRNGIVLVDLKTEFPASFTEVHTDAVQFRVVAIENGQEISTDWMRFEVQE